MANTTPLAQSVITLSGIGSQSVVRLNKLGVYSIQDLLFHLPHRYEDRTRIYPINTLKAGMVVLVSGQIELTELSRAGKKSLICRISDSTGYLALKFFHFSDKQMLQLTTGRLICCFGELRYSYQSSALEMIHPEYKLVTDTTEMIEPCLTSIYPLTEGLHQSTLRKAVAQALSLYLSQPDGLIDWLPATVLAQLNYPTLSVALQCLHQPEPQITVQHLQQGHVPALKRLAFEELLAHHLILLQNKHAVKKWQAPIFTIDRDKQQAFLQPLPFQLTQAQQRVINQISQDCESGQPMLRLIQGDVGSGKTIVAAYATLIAVVSGYQVAIMAPTELLAEQHYHNFQQWFDTDTYPIAYLTGRVTGKARQQLLTNISDGSAGIIIGTHALFQDSVHFQQLGLIVIDEQHRFGVHQRLALREKGQTQQQRPHQLVMTATPIPRTLAMLQYSDLDISIIDELPAGRQPVKTCVIPATRREQVIAKINQWTANNNQTYWVCTLIEESEVLQCEAAEKTAAYLMDILPDVRIALVHGKMKSADKQAIMQGFKQHQYDLLVATTVIEVGVDVPNASLMIIENAERLGLSQLHQLRGRVGRGQQQSYCLLMYQPPLSPIGQQRLSILRASHDGFVIAEKDLELRGPGDVMGTRQTGLMQFKIANLERDIDLLESVQQVAETICHDYPDNIQPIIDRWIGQSTLYSEV